MPVAEPHKELRFTRAAQAVPLWIATAVLATAALILFVVGFHRDENPALPHPLWSLLPLVLAWGCGRVALRCTKHAYLILSPLGVEIFPLLRPQRGMQLVPWAQVTGAEIGDFYLTLHFADDQSAGIHLSLSPIPKPRRPLLAQAIQGRLGERAKSPGD